MSGNIWDVRTHLKEIPNTRLLVSAHYRLHTSANLEVYDVSQKGQVKKIYSFEEVPGTTGSGFVACDSRRGILGAISVRGETVYHLYNFATGNTGNIVKLIRKSRWHSQYGDEFYNYLTDLDFNPNGEIAAAVDCEGKCLISDINTDIYRFHMDMMNRTHGTDPAGCCRWSTNSDEPLLFIKSERSQIFLLDTEKQIRALKEPVQIESPDKYTCWIDVCQSSGSLLASGGDDMNVKIFGKRESKIVRTLDGIHTDQIHCVRWSPSGEMLATASRDKTTTLLDFKTGKILYTGKVLEDTFPESNF